MNVVKDCTVVQEIFNTVIEAGIYDPEHPTKLLTFMCYSLSCACNRLDVITYTEESRASEAIKDYIAEIALGDITLVDALRSAGLPHSPANRLAIYQDWDNRPRKQE